MSGNPHPFLTGGYNLISPTTKFQKFATVTYKSSISPNRCGTPGNHLEDMVSRRTRKNHPPPPPWVRTPLEDVTSSGILASVAESRDPLSPGALFHSNSVNEAEFSRDRGRHKPSLLERAASEPHSPWSRDSELHAGGYPDIPTDDFGEFMSTLVEGMRSDGAQLASTAKEAVASTLDVSFL